MKETLQPGLTFQLAFKVPENKTVPHLYPEAEEFQAMPAVLATGFLVGLFEWACIKAINPHISWPDEQTVGTKVNITHTAATPPGLTVTVTVKLEKVEGRLLYFHLEAHDGVEKVSEGTHERVIIDAAKFNTKLQQKIR